ncbi:hypothetical protein [Streptomyces lavendofoliae]|uniref:hypothetical protein n=1 Tax=Streptomyces lavendofoliae TaxID=67314 RepID=UPI003D8E1B01
MNDPTTEPNQDPTRAAASTPSQAEGAREPGDERQAGEAADTDSSGIPRTTPSQAEGERDTDPS